MEQYGEFAVSNLEQTMHDGFMERIFSVTDSKVRNTYYSALEGRTLAFSEWFDWLVQLIPEEGMLYKPSNLGKVKQCQGDVMFGGVVTNYMMSGVWLQICDV